MKNEQQFFKITAHSIEFKGLSHEFTYKRGARNYEEEKIDSILLIYIF